MLESNFFKDLMIGTILLFFSGVCYWQVIHLQDHPYQHIFCMEQINPKNSEQKNSIDLLRCKQSADLITDDQTLTKHPSTAALDTQAIILANQQVNRKVLFYMITSVFFLILGGLWTIKAIQHLFK